MRVAVRLKVMVMRVAVKANSLWGNNIASGLMFLVFMAIFHLSICMSFNRILGGRSC